MKNISQEELKEILKKHEMWLNDEEDGECADLSYVDLKCVDLSCTNLRAANLMGINLSDSNLHNADLTSANLENVDLWNANLINSKLVGIKTNIHTIGYNLACPEEGSFIGYKKASRYIVKLLILEDAKRSSATTSKCRCDKAKVLEIKEIETGRKVKRVSSNYDFDFIYEVGKVVTVDDFDEDRWSECSTGIHFFMNKENALNY